MNHPIVLMQKESRIRFGSSLALSILLGFWTHSAQAVSTLCSFEDSSEGWVLNADWGKGFTSLQDVDGNATQGDRSLKITFSGQSYKWGAYLQNITDPTFLNQLKYGGTLLLDLVIPSNSTGVQNFGFAFQQNGVEGSWGWQQNWFPVGGKTGKFTIELPVQRTGTNSISLHLGQNGTANSLNTVYVDNLRLIPNGPPPPGVTVTRTAKAFSFEDGTTEGFDIVDQAWSKAFVSVEPAQSQATDGSTSLKTTFSAGDWGWGAWAYNIARPDVLSAFSEKGTLLVDVFIPETSAGIQQLGLTLLQSGAPAGKDWQQVWYDLGGKTGKFTIDLPFTRETRGSIGILLGRNYTGTQDAEVYWDNFRVVTQELVGAVASATGTAKASITPAGKVQIDFTGGLESSDSVQGPFNPIVGTTSPLVLDPAAAGPKRFYRPTGGSTSTGEAMIYLSDDFESSTTGWAAKWIQGNNGGPAWERGTPAFGDEITFAHSGAQVWATGLASGYGINSVTTLTSPVIDLSKNTTGARIAFYEILDVGGASGDADKAEIYVRSADGTVFTGLEKPIWSGSQVVSTPLFFQRRTVDIPTLAGGSKIRLEFRVTSDDVVENPQKGWLLDDVSVYAKP